MTARIEEHRGPRAQLRALFALAEDSDAELDAYIDTGRLLVAWRAGDPIGHLQLTEADDPQAAEIKNMAVIATERGNGVGRSLVEAAAALARRDGRHRLLVATATADIGNLRFYQRVGFRLLAVERDAFTEASGYPAGLEEDGIPVRARVWLARES